MKKYLLYAAESYAFSIMRPLQAEIRRRGHEVAWFLEKVSPHLLLPHEKQLKTVKEVLNFQPRAVFVPGNWVPHFFPGVKVQIFHGFGIEKKGHFRIRGFFDLYCTHGPLTTRPFQELAAKHNHFHVAETGWPKMDDLFNVEETPDQGEQPIILFAPTFSPSLTAAPELLETIKDIAARRNWKWLVKFHPKMDPEWVAAYEKSQSPNLEVIADPDLNPLLRIAHVMVSDTSSAVAEFLLQDKPVVTFRNKEPGPHVLDLQEKEQLEDAVAHALTRSDELMKGGRFFAEQMHPYRDGHSSARVLDATEALINGKMSPVGKKPLNLLRKFKVRRRVGYYRLF